MIEDVKGGVRLHLFVQPKASKNEVVGAHDKEIKVKITAPPLDGRANEGLIEFMSDLFKLPKKNIQLVRGESSRHKVIEIQGITPEKAREILKIS